MNFEFMHPRETRIEKIYDGISPELINYAENYLRKIIDGEIQSMNITGSDAERYLKELRDGVLPGYSVRAFGYNYMDYLEKKEGIK